MKISRTELKRMTREKLRKRGLSYPRYMEIVGGEKRYFDRQIKFLRTMAEGDETLVRRYLMKDGYKGL